MCLSGAEPLAIGLPGCGRGGFREHVVLALECSVRLGVYAGALESGC